MRIHLLGEFSNIEGDLVSAFKRNGFEVTQTRSLGECRSLASHDEFDLLILEKNLPDGDAIEWMEQLRQAGLKKPSLLIADPKNAPKNPEDLGISAVIDPTTSLAALIEKITALGNQIHCASVIQIGDLSIDRLNRSVHVQEEEIYLSETEFDLLWLLAENRGKVVSTTRCLSGVWGLTHDPQSNRVSVYMKKLRAKLPNKQLIHTLRGVGYVLDPDRSS
jgi:two-component system, OmpR family, response regulator